MILMEDIARQVMENCVISDARHAGSFSVCGLVLRLRDLYKWEKGLAPWVEGESGEVLDWIGRREEQWDLQEEIEFAEIYIEGRTYDPFDIGGINKELEPLGFLYGAGLARALKPFFFLAVIEEKRKIRGHEVYILGKELARDLLTMPAFSRDGVIVVRKDSARVYLWDQIAYMGKSGRPALRFALEQYGPECMDYKKLPGYMDTILADEVGTYIHHEIGESEEKEFSGEDWREMVGAFPHSPIELLARAVKDLLADTNEYGTIRYIAGGRRSASLGFFVAFLDGLRREIFPEMREAFSEFLKTKDWELIERARRAGYEKAAGYAELMVSAFERGRRRGDPGHAREEIERRILAPLGLTQKIIE